MNPKHARTHFRRGIGTIHTVVRGPGRPGSGIGGTARLWHGQSRTPTARGFSPIPAETSD